MMRKAVSGKHCRCTLKDGVNPSYEGRLQTDKLYTVSDFQIVTYGFQIRARPSPESGLVEFPQHAGGGNAGNGNRLRDGDALPASLRRKLGKKSVH
jgi:hypothetical protein